MSRSQSQKIAAIILASGHSTRLGEKIPKQFQNVSGKLLLEWSLDVFLSVQCLMDVYVLVHPTHKIYTNRLQQHDKRLTFLEGGESRFESSWRALKALANTSVESVLIHDAARPFVSVDLIDRVLAAPLEWPSVVPGVPCHDTLRQTASDSTLCRLDRSTVYRIQTPQRFHRETLYQAYQSVARTYPLDAFPNTLTDDAAVLEECGIAPRLVEGCPKNFKITTAEDLHYARFLTTQNGCSNGARL